MYSSVWLHVCLEECKFTLHVLSLHATVLGLKEYRIFVNGYGCTSICNCLFICLPIWVCACVGRRVQKQKLQTLQSTRSLEKWILQVTDLDEPARITVATQSKQQKHTVHLNTLALCWFGCVFHCGHDNITAQFSINFKELYLSLMLW